MVANDVAGGKGSITDVHIESQSPNTLKYDSLYAEIRFVARRIFFFGKSGAVNCHIRHIAGKRDPEFANIRY